MSDTYTVADFEAQATYNDEDGLPITSRMLQAAARLRAQVDQQAQKIETFRAALSKAADTNAANIHRLTAARPSRAGLERALERLSDQIGNYADWLAGRRGLSAFDAALHIKALVEAEARRLAGLDEKTMSTQRVVGGRYCAFCGGEWSEVEPWACSGGGGLHRYRVHKADSGLAGLDEEEKKNDDDQGSCGGSEVPTVAPHEPPPPLRDRPTIRHADDGSACPDFLSCERSVEHIKARHGS